MNRTNGMKGTLSWVLETSARAFSAALILLAGEVICFAQVDRLAPLPKYPDSSAGTVSPSGQAPIQRPEDLPPPVVDGNSSPETDQPVMSDSAIPYIAPTPADVRQYPLWSDYQGDQSGTTRVTAGRPTECQCQQCQPRRARPVKKFFGKLTHGLDVIIFGSGVHHRSCDSGCCDATGVANDGACDAIGPGVHHPPMHHHTRNSDIAPKGKGNLGQTEKMKATERIQQQQRQRLPVNRRAPGTPAIPPQPNTPGGEQLRDPFVDDPITANGSLRERSAGYRR